MRDKLIRRKENYLCFVSNNKIYFIHARLGAWEIDMPRKTSKNPRYWILDTKEFDTRDLYEAVPIKDENKYYCSLVFPTFKNNVGTQGIYFQRAGSIWEIKPNLDFTPEDRLELITVHSSLTRQLSFA